MVNGVVMLKLYVLLDYTSEFILVTKFKVAFLTLFCIPFKFRLDRTNRKYLENTDFYSMKFRRTITIFSNVGAYNISIDDDEEKSGPNILLSYHDNMHYNSVHDRSNNYISSSTSSNKNTTTQSAQTSKRKKNKSILTEKNKSNIDQNDRGNDVMTSQSHKSNRSSTGRKKNDDDIDDEQKVKDNGNTNVSSKNLLTQRRNDICSCGSGLRYKKCCLAKEKSSIRLKKFREKHALQGYNKHCDNAEYKDSGNGIELDGGFTVLNI